MTLAILTPSRGEPHPHYIGALAHNVELPHIVLTLVGKDVDVARNELTEHVRTMDERPRYVAWIDDDAYWMRGTISRLIANLEAAKRPYRAVAGGFHGGRFPLEQVHAYRRKGLDFVTVPLQKRQLGMREKPMVVPCDMMGSHFLVHRTELLDALEPAPWSVPDDSEVGEDFMFSERVRAVGGNFLADLTLPIFHCDDDFLYLPDAPAMTMVDGTPRPALLANRGGQLHRYGKSVDEARDRWLAHKAADPAAIRTAKLVRAAEAAARR